MISVLHVVSHLADGGAAHALLNLLRGSAARGVCQHAVLSLRPVSQAMRWELAQRGVALLSMADEHYRAALDEATVVQVEYWNTPEMWQWLRSDLPPMRALLWSHTGGLYAPQVITSALIEAVELVVTSSEWSAGLPVFAGRRPPVIHAVGDFARPDGIVAQRHSGFNVGYIGTCSPVKMHPNFVALCGQVAVPEARFIVCGSQLDRRRMLRQAEAEGVAARLELRGYVEDTGAVLAELDVFGYPLCVDNYSSYDLALQEAMYAAVPPVVLRHGAAQGMVQHGETGYVAATEAEYCRAIEYLAQYPTERRRLGQAAHQYIVQHFSIERALDSFYDCYRALLARPKRVLRWPGAAPSSGAALFAFSLGDAGAAFNISLYVRDEQALLDAEQVIRAASPALCGEGSGGIFHYRNVFAGDPHLRLWSGLALLGQGQHARALSEFKASWQFGLRHWRLQWYMGQAAVGLGATAPAREFLCQVIADAPHFSPAQRLADSLAERLAV